MVSVNNAATNRTAGASAASKNAASTTPENAQQSRNMLDYNAFLKLFIEQLKHQDPTAPMEAKDSLAQLAMFSQVEQTTATNKKLDTLLAAVEEKDSLGRAEQMATLNEKLDTLLAVNRLAQASNFIGRTVISEEGEMEGQVVSVKMTHEGPLATLHDNRTILLNGEITVA